ncbi:glutathione S-transferase family protein [Neisseria sp. 23W00296]|uniref:glutathione S-transferase family protein n=1 Tax=unclassified Neisseria TaxID=2623750 RepID=UPI0037582930
MAAGGGLEDQFEFNETMAFLTGDFHPAFWPMFSPNRYTTEKTVAAHDAVREAAYARIDRVMTFLNNLIGESGHVFRDKRSVADAYAFVMARWSVKTPKSYKEYPHLAAFMQKMSEDAAVKKVLELSK